MTELMQTIAQIPPGSKAKIKVSRRGSETELSVAIAERPSPPRSQ